MLRSPTIIVGLVIVAIFLVLSIGAPYISPHDPLFTNTSAVLVPPIWEKGGNSSFPLGTDFLGRDILSWIIWGTRTSFLLSVILIFISATIGTALGIVSGYLGGTVDTIMMRVVDFFMAFPVILLALMLAVILGTGILTVSFVVTVHLWAGFARMARGETLRVKSSDFIDAAKVMGISKPRIMLRHIFPNAMTPIIVLGTLNIGRTALFVSTLSFLGAGIPLSIPDWGNLISLGRNYLISAPWICLAPSVALFVVILCFNILGDKFSEYLNPELRTKMRAR
jgi:ABC-type dipeptide/oligopeptide/nickel transport system permease subunit